MASKSSRFLKVEDILPQHYKYKIISERRISNECFHSIVRLAIFTKQRALKWFQEFQTTSFVKFHHGRTYWDNNHKFLFKSRYKCVYNNNSYVSPYAVTPPVKNTGCAAKLRITINRPEQQGDYPLVKQYPCEVVISHDHNHPIRIVEVKKIMPCEEVEEYFVDLFKKGYAPTTALDTYKETLKREYGQCYDAVIADSSACPTQQWCYNLYYSVTKAKRTFESDMLAPIEKCISDYNGQKGSICASISKDGGFIIAICSPLMKRIHLNIKEASDIVFLDSTGTMNQHNSKVYSLLCASPAGCLPLGLIITHSENDKTIGRGITLLKSMLDEKSFYGQNYPKVIITNDNEVEKNNLKTVFPDSTILVCKYHVLHNLVKFLWDGKNAVENEDRIYIYKLFKKLVNITCLNEFFTISDAVKNDPIVTKYKNVEAYFTALQSRSQEWASCYRRSLSENACSNIISGITKDRYLHHVNSLSALRMFNFLTSKYMQYYVKIITDVINNDPEIYKRISFFTYKSLTPITNLKCIKLSSDEELYKVIANSKNFIVNWYTGTCTCIRGNQGSRCKHQYAIEKLYNPQRSYFNPVLGVNEKESLQNILIDNYEVSDRTATSEIVPVDTIDLDAETLDNSSDGSIIELKNVGQNPKMCFSTLNSSIVSNKKVCSIKALVSGSTYLENCTLQAKNLSNHCDGSMEDNGGKVVIREDQLSSYENVFESNSYCDLSAKKIKLCETNTFKL